MQGEMGKVTDEVFVERDEKDMPLGGKRTLEAQQQEPISMAKQAEATTTSLLARVAAARDERSQPKMGLSDLEAGDAPLLTRL
eukprot:1212161-Lingulodinium_polyedra.AAC.1